MIKALLLSKDEDLEVHLKKELILMQCQYFSKTEDQCSQAMEQAAKKAFENNMHHHDTMQEMARTYLSNQECSDQQTLFAEYFLYFRRIEAQENFSGSVFH